MKDGYVHTNGIESFRAVPKTGHVGRGKIKMSSKSERTAVWGAIVCLAVLISSCTFPASTPACQTDDVYGYLSCAEPQFSWNHDEIGPEEREKETRSLSDWTISYCSDDSVEWLPVLDRNVKESVPKSREIIRDGLDDADGEKLNEDGIKLPQQDHDTLEREFKSLKDRKLFSYVLGLYLMVPVLRAKNEGVSDKETCVDLFERIEASGAVEHDVRKRFFGQYEFYFDR